MRMRIRCDSCDREFIERWRADTHICESGILARIKEWRKWRKMDRFDKFLHELHYVDGEMAIKVEKAMHNWQKSRPPSCVVDIEEELDPLEVDRS